MAWNHDQRKQAAAAAKAKAAVEAQQNAEFNVRVYCVAKRLETSVTLTRGLVSTEVLDQEPLLTLKHSWHPISVTRSHTTTCPPPPYDRTRYRS